MAQTKWDVYTSIRDRNDNNYNYICSVECLIVRIEHHMLDFL